MRKMSALGVAALLVLGPGRLSGQLREIRQTIFGMD